MRVSTQDSCKVREQARPSSSNNSHLQIDIETKNNTNTETTNKNGGEMVDS